MSIATGDQAYPTCVTTDLDLTTLAIRRGGIYIRVRRSYLLSSYADPGQLIRLHAVGRNPAQPGKFSTKVVLAQHCISRCAGTLERKETAQMLLDLFSAAYPNTQVFVKYGNGF